MPWGLARGCLRLCLLLQGLDGWRRWLGHLLRLATRLLLLSGLLLALLVALLAGCALLLRAVACLAVARWVVGLVGVVLLLACSARAGARRSAVLLTGACGLTCSGPLCSGPLLQLCRACRLLAVLVVLPSLLLAVLPLLCIVLASLVVLLLCAILPLLLPRGLLLLLRLQARHLWGLQLGGPDNAISCLLLTLRGLCLLPLRLLLLAVRAILVLLACWRARGAGSACRLVAGLLR